MLDLRENAEHRAKIVKEIRKDVNTKGIKLELARTFARKGQTLTIKLIEIDLASESDKTSKKS